MPAIQRRTFQGYDFLNTDRSFRFDRVAFNRPRAWITALERESDFAANFLLLYLDILKSLDMIFFEIILWNLVGESRLFDREGEWQSRFIWPSN